MITPSPRIRNCTPHLVRLEVFFGEPGDGRADIVELPPSGVIPRVEITRQNRGSIAVAMDQDEVGRVPLARTSTGQVTGLPEYEEGVFLLVSRQVAEAAPERGDLLIVDETVRGEDGRILAARSLASLAHEDALERVLRDRQRLQALHISRLVG